MTETMTGRASELMQLNQAHAAHNYHPLPVVVSEADGAWVTDVEGRRYLDMLAAYSALNFGHRHPRLIAAAMSQLDRLTLVSRAFDHDQFGPFCAELAELAGLDVVLPMNTGAEAVETAIKVARKWGYTVKGVPAGQAVIIVFGGNFHGRTTTIVSFSTDDDARADFGPYTPGFRVVPYGDLDAVRSAVDELGERVVAVLVEPIQGEAGVIVPPPGFLPGLRELCLDKFGLKGIDWVIVGGESGHGARPMKKEWVVSLRDECKREGVPFFFKQWGGVRKKAAGRKLDGKTYDEFPQRVHNAVLEADECLALASKFEADIKKTSFVEISSLSSSRLELAVI